MSFLLRFLIVANLFMCAIDAWLWSLGLTPEPITYMSRAIDKFSTFLIVFGAYVYYEAKW